VAFSPDGGMLAVAGATGGALWDLRTHRRTKLDSGDGGYLGLATAVAFAPDGKTVAVGYDRGPYGSTELWDVPTHRRLRALENEDSTVGTIAFSGDGRTVAVGNYTGTTTLFDPRTGDRQDALTPSKAHAVTAVAYSPDGRTIAIGYIDGRTRLYDAATRRPGPSWHHKAGVFGLAFSPDGQTLATGASDNLIRLWSVP
jgi:WD40 repeat protein